MPDQIRLATKNDFDFIWLIVNECSDLLVSKGLMHWKRYYTKEIVKNKIKEGVYCLIHNREIIGVISAQTKTPEYYTEKDMNYFTKPRAKAVYISMLAVRPRFHGKGFALKLIWFAEKVAKEKGIKFSRLDTYGKYIELGKFYEKRGYMKVGSYEEDSYDIALYEKELK